MGETKTEKTVASELREAAARVRKAGAEASRSPWRRDGMAIATGSGMAALAYNGVDARWIELAAPDLAEPLASWLEKTAEGVAKAVYEDEICDIPGGSKDQCEADCRGHDPVLVCDECGNLLAPTSPRQGPACSCWTAALAVARVLNGSAHG